MALINHYNFITNPPLSSKHLPINTTRNLRPHMPTTRAVIFTISALLLFGCSSRQERLADELNNTARQVQNNVQNLRKHIDSNRIRNARLLTEYAKVVKNLKPDYRKIVDALAEDATSSGPMFQSLLQRLNEAKKQIPVAVKSTASAQNLADEFNSINVAAQTRNYNMMLSDPLNVLADMSDGKLARVADLSSQAAANQSQPSAGRELIGNPQYGRWRTNSSGGTFWEWYGKYALFSRLFNFGGYDRYSYWSSHRYRYPSYYHDLGRDYYSSPHQKQQYQQTETRVKKQFARQGLKFNSPYARKAVTTRKPVFEQPNKFKSSYSRSSTSRSSFKSSRYGSSSYNSRSSGFSSRSFGFGGK